VDRSQIVYQKNSDVFKINVEKTYAYCYLFNVIDRSIDQRCVYILLNHVTENNYINIILSYSWGRFLLSLVF
jgi:hypothetical protein